VAVREGELVGFILGKPWEDESTKFYIGWVTVVPKARSQGFEQRLLKRLLTLQRRNDSSLSS